MNETYSCTYVNCDKVFSKAYELKKHKATHDDPDSVYYCSECDFFTLQKKNLGIHFAIHTGEKIHQCPDMVSIDGPGSPSCEERCEYRTNDPAALTKHRKKFHGYIPPPSRSRPSPSKVAPASPRKPRKPRQKQDRKASRHPRPFQRPVPVSCRKPSRVRRVDDSSSGGAGYASTSTESPEDSSPFLWQGDAGAHGQWMDAYSSDVSGYDSSISSSATLVAPDEEMDLTTLYDPSLHSEWMAKYEMGYSMFDETGMVHLPEPLHVALSSVPASLDMQTGRGGCLCPEWMVEAGIEGWDQSVLETHREFYAFDA